MKVVITGGGLAGLTAALHLAERGLKPLVLEANPDFAGGRVGGKPAVCLTAPDGKKWIFPAEHGIHGFWQQYLNLKAMLARHQILPAMVKADRQIWVHGKGNKVTRAEMGRVVRRTFWPAPFHYTALFFRPSFLKMLGLRDILAIPQVLSSLLAAVSIDPMTEGRNFEGKTMADFCRGWPPAIRAFVATLARSGLSAQPESVPLAGFIAFLRFYTVHRRDSQAFEYLPEGADAAFITPLLNRITELGGEVRLGSSVNSLEVDESGSGWRVSYQTAVNEEVQYLKSVYVILAADAPGTARILKRSKSTVDVAAGLSWPKGLETAVIRAWYSCKPEKKAEAGIVSGDFIIDNFFWLHRFQKIFGEWQAETGGSAVEAHIYGPPEILAQSDQHLLERGLADLNRIFPKMNGKLQHATIQRNPPTHTLFALGSLASHLGVRTPWPGLFCCGDWVRHHNGALFLERATVTGIEAANAVLTAENLAPFSLISHRKPEILARLIGVILRNAAHSVK